MNCQTKYTVSNTKDILHQPKSRTQITHLHQQSEISNWSFWLNFCVHTNYLWLNMRIMLTESCYFMMQFQKQKLYSVKHPYSLAAQCTRWKTSAFTHQIHYFGSWNWHKYSLCKYIQPNTTLNYAVTLFTYMFQMLPVLHWQG